MVDQSKDDSEDSEISRSETKELCLPVNSGKLVIYRRSEKDGAWIIRHRGQCCIAIGISVNVVPNGVEYSHAMFIFDKLEKA